MDLSIQELIESGMAWRLEGHVGRQCMAAIENGDAVLGTVGLRDYWGNYVPSRFEVESGTKGSLGYANDLRSERGDEPLVIEWTCDTCPFTVVEGPDHWEQAKEGHEGRRGWLGNDEQHTMTGKVVR